MQSTDHEFSNPALPPDAKAEQILFAARDVFLELGYAAASMDLVAQRARVSKTTLYTRFPSKEELYTAVISAECDRYGMRFRPEMFDGVPVRDVLVGIGTRFIDLIWSEPAIRVHQSVVGEAARMPEVARLFFQAGPEKAIAALAALFERMAQHGLIVTDDPAFAANQFLATMKGGAHCARELGLCPVPTEAERDAFVAKAVDLFLRGIQPAGQ
ncbi:TetR/AcrR family transcriptional regulator [Azospirillum sp. TSO35-2]|uniref:TetR/AcrR family transcriptional regulator n=1 Tax=Azospirillum sp. TSO35-2 TaxID=716796 RepID=UPI000D61A058|nr:TetR/AcrR family transcriptional regulator [Azospirillum sp. TSO35-2]PWC31276.1 TetR family transcriptional regulator [Azospirillum sp. TSO35-2]